MCCFDLFVTKRLNPKCSQAQKGRHKGQSDVHSSAHRPFILLRMCHIMSMWGVTQACSKCVILCLCGGSLRLAPNVSYYVYVGGHSGLLQMCHIMSMWGVTQACSKCVILCLCGGSLRLAPNVSYYVYVGGHSGLLQMCHIMSMWGVTQACSKYHNI